MSEPAPLRLVVPRELKSPNAWMWKHWRVKQKEREGWETDIAWTLLRDGQKKNTYALLAAMNAIKPRRVCDRKRRVVITRIVPSTRRFIRDDDNLRFAVKPVNDALKRLGLIKDDNRKWLDQPMPEQIVSVTGEVATVIEINNV